MELPIARAVNGRRISALVALALVGSAVGCVQTEAFFHPEAAVDVPACQVVATWYPEVVSTPDPAHGGAPTPGLAGRVYLFGPEVKCPLVGDGRLVVDLFDDTPSARACGATAPLEEWRFDRDTLKRLQRRDAVGMGYTLFLPWGTYRPETTQVHLRLRYEPAQGAALYDESASLVLRRPGMTSWQHTDIPALAAKEAVATNPQSRSASIAPEIRPVGGEMLPGQSTVR